MVRFLCLHHSGSCCSAPPAAKIEHSLYMSKSFVVSSGSGISEFRYVLPPKKESSAIGVAPVNLIVRGMWSEPVVVLRCDMLVIFGVFSVSRDAEHKK